MKSVFGLSILLALTVSCKKGSQDNGHGSDCHNAYMSAETANFKFKKGTYWVYMDSVSLITDTVRVDTVLFNGMIDIPQCSGLATMEYYRFRINTGSPKNEYAVNLNELILNQTNGSGTTIYTANMPRIDSVFIYDRYYRSVQSYTKANEPSENNHKTVFYTNSTFGFLKKEVYNSSNQLISQKLLKDKYIVR
jgi:hypothetical protein